MPDVNIVSPNTAINISGIFPVDFNVIDPNHDDLNFKLAYSSTAGSFQNVIVTNSSLSSLCTTTNWVRTTRCTYSWNTAGVQGVYYLDINVFDSRLAGHTDPSDSNFTVNFAPLQLRTDYVNTYALKSGLGGMDINWGNISGETGFKLYRSSNAGLNWTNIATLAADVNTYRDTGVGDNNSLIYKVSATNGAFESTYSNADSNITVDRSAPTVPANFKTTRVGSATTLRADINWGVSDDNSSYAQLVDKNLFGYWRFSEFAGNFASDSSDSMNNAFSVNTSIVPGKMGNALSFNGTTAYATAADSNALDYNASLTLSVWIKTTQAASTTAAIAGKGFFSASVNGYGIYLDSNDSYHVRFQTRTGATNVTADGGIVNDGKWHNVTGVRNSSTNGTLIYVDGVLKDTNTQSALTNMSSDKNFGIGAAYVGSSWMNFFAGFIDEVIVFDKALSATDVNTLYTIGARRYDLTRSTNGGTSYTPRASFYDTNTFADLTALDLNAPTVQSLTAVTANTPTQLTPGWSAATDQGSLYFYKLGVVGYYGNDSNTSADSNTINAGLHATKPYFLNCYSGGATTVCTSGENDAKDANVNATSSAVTGLDVNKSYCFTLKSRDAALNESAASSQSCKYTLANVPSISTVNCTYASDFRCVVSFDFNGNPSTTSYYIDETTSASGGTDSGWINAASPYTDTGLATGTQYCYTIKARNGNLVESGVSAQVCGTQPNNEPLINWIQVCDSNSSCGNSKTLNPSDTFVIDVNVFDPDNDLNWDSTRLELYPTADSNGVAADWDHITLNPATATASQYGCDAGTSGTGDDNCFSVTSSDWTTKFAKGGTDVYARVCDTHGGCGNLELTSGITVNAYPQGFGFDENFSFSAAPDTNNNALTSAGSNAYLLMTNTGNVSIDLNMLVGNLTSGSDNITYNNMHWKLTAGAPGTYFASNFATGTGGVVKASLSRGSYPTNGTDTLYAWLNVPLGTPSGTYTGTYNFYSKES